MFILIEFLFLTCANDVRRVNFLPRWFVYWGFHIAHCVVGLLNNYSCSTFLFSNIHCYRRSLSLVMLVDEHSKQYNVDVVIRAIIICAHYRYHL